MAIKIADEYTNAVAASASYPGGSFKNRTTPEAGDGTPLEKAWANDLYGFGEALLAAGGVVHSGAPDTALASDRLTALRRLMVDAIFPIGSIYITRGVDSPDTLFVGSVWQKVEQGYFLISAGAQYIVNSSGGEATHTLTVAEMPAHSHVQTNDGTDVDAGWGNSAGTFSVGTARSGTPPGPGATTSSVGGGAPHNNMPPYYAVNMWIRVA